MDTTQQSTSPVAAPTNPTQGLSFGGLTLSLSFGRIYAALLAAQTQIEATRRSGLNEDFDSAYPTLEDVINAVKAPLNKQGVVVLQPVTTHQNRVRVTTLLLLEGEYLSSSMEMTARDASPHAIASTITYAQRISLKSLLFLPAADDDGNAGVRPDKGAARPAGATPTRSTGEGPTKQAEPGAPAEAALATEAAESATTGPSEAPPAGNASPAESPLSPAPSNESAPEPQAAGPEPTSLSSVRAARQAASSTETPAATSSAMDNAPPDLTDAERMQIQRLHKAVVDKTCSLEQARASLQEGGVSFSRLRPHVVLFARSYILGDTPSKGVADIDAAVGF